MRSFRFVVFSGCIFFKIRHFYGFVIVFTLGLWVLKVLALYVRPWIHLNVIREGLLDEGCHLANSGFIFFFTFTCLRNVFEDMNIYFFCHLIVLELYLHSVTLCCLNDG